MSRSTSRLQVVGIAAGLIAAGLFAVEPLGAQTVPPPDNVGPIIGLYTTQTIGDDTATDLEVPTVWSLFDIWVVLSHSDSEYIVGVEFRIEMSPELAAGVFHAGTYTGSLVYQNLEFPDISTSFPPPYPNFVIIYVPIRYVVDGHAWLARITYRAMLPGLSGHFFLTPWSGQENMVFIGDSDPPEIEIMRPNSEGQLHANPVFSLTTGMVPVEAHSLSAIKALFR
jgi:hypothetical protein